MQVDRRGWIPRSGRPLPIPARPRLKPGRVLARAFARQRPSGRAGGVARLHHAVRPDHARFRARRGGVHRPDRRRIPAWPQARRGRRGGASRMGHDADAHAGSHAGDDRARRHRCSRRRGGVLRADRRDRARRGRGSSPLPRRNGTRRGATALSRIQARRRGALVLFAAIFALLPVLGAHGFQGFGCSKRSIARARLCSAAAMSCCPCSRRKSSRRAG
jgi:hypothetical protein